jgi:hypothetical protein
MSLQKSAVCFPSKAGTAVEAYRAVHMDSSDLMKRVHFIDLSKLAGNAQPSGSREW